MNALGIEVPKPAKTNETTRFKDLVVDESAPSEVFRLLTDDLNRKTLREIARSWKVPSGLFVEWFTTQHQALYDTALRVIADQLAHEALEIVDDWEEAVRENGERFDPKVQRDKLRAETRLKLAAKWDRARYGERIDHKHSHSHDLGDRLRRATERVIEADPQLPSPEAEEVISMEPERDENGEVVI